MLTQSSVGVCVDDSFTADAVTISAHPDVSMNHISLGPVGVVTSGEIRLNSAQAGWVYVTEAGAFYFEANVRPLYNYIFHGWYRDAQGMGDRAIAFIDPELPRGWRTIIMDSPNSMFEHDQRIPDEGGTLVYDSAVSGVPLSQFSPVIRLIPGNYRFEMRGGRGGNGGNNMSEQLAWFAAGGQGADAPVEIFKLPFLAAVDVVCMCGGNGAHGQDGDGFWFSQDVFGGGTERQFRGVSGSGGSSGEDSVVLLAGTDVPLVRGIGGAGGGGAASSGPGQPLPTGFTRATASRTGAGGGGAGSGTAQNGGVPSVPANILPEPLVPGQAGSLGAGGLGGRNTSMNSHTLAGQLDGQLRLGAWQPQRGDSGQGISVGWRRNGGDSGRQELLQGGTSVVLQEVESKGGNHTLNETNGFVRIWRTREFEG